MTLLAGSWDGVAPAQAGPLGLLVILLMGVACFFLFRSMNRQLKKVPESFDPPTERPAAATTPDDEDTPLP